jgi:hypothetical protein
MHYLTLILSTEKIHPQAVQCKRRRCLALQVAILSESGHCRKGTKASCRETWVNSTSLSVGRQSTGDDRSVHDLARRRCWHLPPGRRSGNGGRRTRLLCLTRPASSHGPPPSVSSARGLGTTEQLGRWHVLSPIPTASALMIKEGGAGGARFDPARQRSLLTLWSWHRNLVLRLWIKYSLLPEV